MMTSNSAHEPDGYYEAISDDDSLGDIEEERVNNVNGANQQKDTAFSLDLDALPFVPKFSSEIRNTVEAAAVADNINAAGVVIVGNWGQENINRASETPMECPYFPSEHGTSVVSEKGFSVNKSAELQNPIELVHHETPSQSLSHPFPSKGHDICTDVNEIIENQFVASVPLPHNEDVDLSGKSSVAESNELHQGKSSVVDELETQSAEHPVNGSNKIQESYNWLDENGDPIQGAFDKIEPDVKGDPCVSIVNNTRVEYVFHVKEKTGVASHIESAESVNSQGSETCSGNVASTSCLSLEDSNTGGEVKVSHVEKEEYDQKKLYEASKNKEEYQEALQAASSSVTNEERKTEDSENKPKERFSRFKRNRFLDQTTTEEPETTAQTVKSEAELALESQALTELLREVKQGAERAKEYGALGWQKCPVPVVNKTFLRNTLVSTLREPYRPPRKRGQRHVGLEGRKPYDRESHSRSSSRSSRSDSRSRSSSGSRSRSSSRSRSRSGSRNSHSRSRSRDGKRRKGFHGRNQRGHWPRGGPQNMYYDWQAMEAYMAQYGYPWYGHDAYAMYYEEGWPMDMYYGDPRAWAEYQSYYRGFPPRGRGRRGRGRGFYGNRWAEEEEVVYSDDEYFSSSSLSPSPGPDDDGQSKSSSMSSKRHSQQEGKGSQQKLSKKDSDGAKVKKSKKSKGVESGSDEVSESGSKHKKKKKKKRKKKKHKKVEKDESDKATSKEGGGENDSSRKGTKSEGHILETKSEDLKAKSEDQKSPKGKKKVVKKKTKTSEGDYVTDASGGKLKKKKKLVTGTKASKEGADGKIKGKGKGKSKAKKKISPNEKTESEAKGDDSAKVKEGHENMKGEGAVVEGNDIDVNVSECGKASLVGNKDGKSPRSGSPVNNACQKAANVTDVNKDIELNLTSGSRSSSSHGHTESQKEEQQETMATKTIPDCLQEDTVTEHQDRSIQKPDSGDGDKMNEKSEDRKMESGRSCKGTQEESQGQDSTREVGSSGKSQCAHDEGDPKHNQEANTMDVEVKKRETSQMELNSDNDAPTSKKTRKEEVCFSQTERLNRHTDSKVGRDKKVRSSGELRGVEGKKKEKKRKRETDSDGHVHRHTKRKRRDNELDRDNGDRSSLRDHSSEKGDEAGEQEMVITETRDEGKNTKEKIADRDKDQKDGDKGKMDGDERKTDVSKEKKDGDQRKTYADKDKKGRDKGKVEGNKRKIDAKRDMKDGDKGKILARETGMDEDKDEADGKKGKKEKRKKDRGIGKMVANKRKREVDKKKTIGDNGKMIADKEKEDEKDSTPVLLDAREKIKEKRRKRELERQREMELLNVTGDIETSRREKSKSSYSEDSKNTRHKESDKNKLGESMSASSYGNSGKSKKLEKKTKHATAHVQDEEEVDSEEL